MYEASPSSCFTESMPVSPLMASSGRLSGAMNRYSSMPTAAAATVVSSVYVSVWRNMRPVSFCVPNRASVVVTARAIVGIATN